MFISLTSNNFDLLGIGVAVAAIGIFGFAIYFNNRQSITNRTFLIFCILTIVWSVSDYFNYQSTNPNVILWLLRLHLFISVWYALFFFKLSYVFPQEKISFPGWHKIFLLPATIIISFITLTPFVFSKITKVAEYGQVTNPERGPGIILFGLFAFGLLFASVITLFKKIIKSEGIVKKQTILFFIGILLLVCLILLFSVILPLAFNNLRFLPFAAFFVLPFIIFTAYAIYKHKLFNIKVIAVAFVAFILTIFSLLNVIYATGSSQIILNASFFVLILLGSIILIRSILKEVEQRERLEVLTKELGVTNENLKSAIKQRESLVHLVTHKVKGSFTRSKYIFAGILDGTFGEVTPEMKKYAEQGLESDNMGIETVDLVLNADNLQKGTVKYDMKPINFKEIVEKIVEEKKVQAEKRGIKIENNIVEGSYNVVGDAFWLKEAINNLLENAIKYTRKGEVKIQLENNGGKIRFSIKDTGVGITEEDKKNLFTEGGRGKDSVKVNVDSTGYGLYSVKLIMDAQKGKVWAESEGPDKGSTFFVEMDAVK